MAAPAFDVFLSHSGEDKDFVKELYRRLTRDGVRCFFDIESIGWGDNWVRALERAIDECTYVVFVLSPDFCNSKWAEVERTSNIADDPSGLKRKALPNRRSSVPCGEVASLPMNKRIVATEAELQISPLRFALSKNTAAEPETNCRSLHSASLRSR